LRHFAFLDGHKSGELFHRAPVEVPHDGDPTLLATALGATLYSPGTRPRLARDVCTQRDRGVASMVLCLEDAIPDSEVATAEVNVSAALRTLAEAGEELPMLFVRVRAPHQIPALVARLGSAHTALAGFVLPKFGEDSGEDLLCEVARVSESIGRRLWAMPVLETPEVIYREMRVGALLAIRRLLDKHAESVLAVRIGATDLSGMFGLRRDRDLTIYDIAVVRDAIGDFVNVLARDGGWVISGPVWEYFAGPERLFVSSLRVTPFEHADAPDGAALRSRLVRADLDRLIREVVLDKANGLLGKTVIHPSHAPAVHALHVVTHEEYVDAIEVAGGHSGVRTSSYANKMNEVRPHRRWAEGVLRRADAYGVLRAGHTFVDVLGAHQ
jgi:citrate lyase beta subunit